MPTSKQDAITKAKNKLKTDPQELINEIEEGMKYIIIDRPSINARGGDYTQEVIEKVSQIYREKGWNVSFSGYWLRLS